jgi:hypothetical protein
MFRRRIFIHAVSKIKDKRGIAKPVHNAARTFHHGVAACEQISWIQITLHR